MREKNKPELIQFRGGCDTVREVNLIPPGGFSYIQNMRQYHPGMKKRLGCIKLHTTADSTNTVQSLFQYVKGKKVERHFLAQMSDGDLLDATNNPPTVTTGVFGSELHDGTASSYPASYSVLNDTLLYSNGADQHKIWTGNDMWVNQFVVFKGTASIPTIPEGGMDYTSEVRDSNTSTVAVLNSLGDLTNDFDCVFIRTSIPANTLGFTVQNTNSSTATLNMKYWNGAWTGVTISDGTSSGGATLAQTGEVTWTAPSDIIPKYMFGTVGYWYQLYLSNGHSLDSSVTVSQVTFDAPMATLVNMWDGNPMDLVECSFYDQSATAYYTYATDTIQLGSATSSDIVYVLSTDPVEALYVDVGDTPNTTASTTVNAVYYYDGTQFSSVGTITDGTSGLSKTGWITFGRKTAFPTQFGTNKSFGYWYYFTVDKTLSSSIVVAVKAAPYYDVNEIGTVGYCNASWKSRGCWSFGDENIWISAFGNPQVLNGTDFTYMVAGDGRKHKVVAMTNFYNELLTFQEEKGKDGGCITLIEGSSPANFTKTLLSTKIGALNSQSVVVVDGVYIQTKTQEIVTTVAYCLSKYGVFRIDGKNVDRISGPIQNYFDSTSSNCIRNGYEAKCWMCYDPTYHCLRIGLVSGAAATTPNVFPVYDIEDGTWSFDSHYYPFSSMTSVEAASGNVSILTVAGGTADGQVYLTNSGYNDVSQAIDAYATMEFDGNGATIHINKIVLRLKSGEGVCTLTPTQDGIDLETKTIPA